jgi:hypothetical protein
MQYVFIIFQDENDPRLADPEMHAKYGAFTAEVNARGAYRSSQGLQPTSAATTVRVRDGKTLATDGPFAETKEQIGGVYILECKDRDEAIEFAAKIPSAGVGAIEIRPAWGQG